METRKDEKKSEKKSKFRIEGLEERIAPASPVPDPSKHGGPPKNPNPGGP
jgi:hypothetical protein